MPEPKMPAAAGAAAADEAVLAAMGYKQEFKRRFSPLAVCGIAYSIIGLMPSIALTLVYAFPNGGPVGLLWGWAVGSFFIFISALAMADLGSVMPTSGGLYYWTYHYSPPSWRVFLCYACGIWNTLSTTAATTSITWGTSQLIFAAYAGANPDSDFEPAQWHLFLVFLGVMLVQACVTCVGTHVLARLQTVYMVACTLVALATIVALPAATPPSMMNTAKFAFTGWYNVSGYSDAGAFFLSLLMPAWTIASFDSCVHISEEASNAAFAVPFGIVAAAGMAGVLGWACLVAISFCMGTDLDSIVSADQPLSVVFLNSFGKGGFLTLWIVFVPTTYMMGQSMSLASSRQIFAFSRDGALPGSSWIHRIDARTGTPVNSVWYSTLLSVLLGCICLAGEAASGAIFSLSIVGCSVAYALPVAALLLGPKDAFTPGPWYLGGRLSALVDWTAVAWEALIFVVALLPSALPTSAQDMNYAVVVTGGVALFTVVGYACPVYGAKHWFQGPKNTLDAPDDEDEGRGGGLGAGVDGAQDDTKNGDSYGDSDAGKDSGRRVSLDDYVSPVARA